MTVIAEGVETKEQLEFLTEIGCDMFQGYYFSKPVPVDEFEEKNFTHRT
jgi:EAL domain-containing protein (putative c-di-GMP-specific phosphodiesterase class I)